MSVGLVAATPYLDLDYSEDSHAEVDMNEALGKIDGDALAAEFERYLRRSGR